MALYQIPKNAGFVFHTIPSKAGSPIVTNGMTGKNEVFIPCKDVRMAEKVIRLLSDKNRGNQVHF
jgi:hypothetical protein